MRDQIRQKWRIAQVVFPHHQTTYLSVLLKTPLPRRYSAPVNTDLQRDKFEDQSDDQRMNLRDADADMSMDEVVGTRGKNKASSFFAL